MIEVEITERMCRVVESIAKELRNRPCSHTTLPLANGNIIITDVGYAYDGIDALVKEMYLHIGLTRAVEEETTL